MGFFFFLDGGSGIRKQLDTMNPGICFAPAACGADIIFLEEMIERGSEINILLPFDADMFIKQRVAPGILLKRTQ